VPSAEPGATAQDAWMLSVVGKGGKPREVVLFEDVKDLIDLHQADLQALDRVVDPRARAAALQPMRPSAGNPSPGRRLCASARRGVARLPTCLWAPLWTVGNVPKPIGTGLSGGKRLRDSAKRI